jgi:prephenate dehydratase
MTISIAHLGPTGTNAETAALAYANWLTRERGEQCLLCPYPSIAQTLRSVAEKNVDIAVVPVENSTEGTVRITLDTLWQLDRLKIQQELVLPITHALISTAKSLGEIKTVYSHPQALAQCQKWLEDYLPNVTLVASNSTTEALQQIEAEPTAGAIASPRAAKLYNLPILAANIHDYPDNCTRFWVLGLTPTTGGTHISLAFSFSANIPGVLVKPLQIFADKRINLSRIESRPAKRSIGEYLFFIDLESNSTEPATQSALAELSAHTEMLKIFGNYTILTIDAAQLANF